MPYDSLIVPEAASLFALVGLRSPGHKLGLQVNKAQSRLLSFAEWDSRTFANRILLLICTCSCTVITSLLIVSCIIFTPLTKIIIILLD